MRKISFICIAIFIAFIASLSFSNQTETVFSETSTVATGKVTASTLNVRAEANQNSRRLGTLQQGTAVEIVRLNVNRDWHEIRFNQRLAYVHSNFITIQQTNLNQIVARGTVAVNALNVRAEPNQNSRRITALNSGAQIDIFETGVNREWLKIRINNQWAYVHANFVTLTQTTPNNSTPSANDTVVARGTVTVNALNVRAEPNQNSRRITALNSGAQIDIFETGVNREWLKIRINNQWAYVHANFVTVTPTTPNNSTPSANDTVVARGTVTVNALNVRAEPNQNSRRITALNSGAQIDIFETGVNREWLKIRINNQWAYVHANFVTVTPTSTPNNREQNNTVVARGTVTVNALNVRSEPNQTARRITTLSAGTTIDIYETGVNRDWLKIKLNNEWAYVHGSFVTLIGNNPTINTSNLRNKVIVIDPGHGGRDPGAVAFGFREKDIVLDISLILQRQLQQAGARVHMTRTEDIFVSLSNRAQVVRRENADIFISIHANSASQATVHGTETFWNRNFQSRNSQLLATSLQNQLVSQLGTRDRGVKEASFEIIKYTQVPSVLVELGFLTNQAEAQRLANRQFQEQAAQAIVAGLVDYYNNN